MSAHVFSISHDVAELLIDLLECNWVDGRFTTTAREGMDLAVELRKRFGMSDPPDLSYDSMPLGTYSGDATHA